MAFADKFRVELSASQKGDTPWMLSLFKRTSWLRRLTDPIERAFDWVTSLRIDLPTWGRSRVASRTMSRSIDAMWFTLVALLALYCVYEIAAFVATTLSWHDLLVAFGLTMVTMARVVILLFLATLFWVPVGVWIGLRPKLAEKVQPLAQFLAAFPANVVFPIAVIGILSFHLNPDIWLSFLIIFGTQWYIVFNVIAGASAYPNDLKEAAANFRITGWSWWRNVILPGIFPYYVTGALTASGGSWNAAIVAEYVKWGDDRVVAHGIGSYIAQATDAGDFPRIVLGVAVMSICVILFNRLLWRPLFGFAERRLRIN